MSRKELEDAVDDNWTLHLNLKEFLIDSTEKVMVIHICRIKNLRGGRLPFLVVI